MKKSIILIFTIAALILGFSVMAQSSPPTGIIAMPISPTAITLSWTASGGAVNYEIYRNSTSTAPIATTTLLTYTDTGLLTNTLYAYYLTALDASSTRSAFSDPAATSTLSDITAPSIPAGLTTTPVSDSQINLSWNPAIDDVSVAGYRIYRDNNLRTTISTTSFSDTGLNASTTYGYQVSALDAAGNESARSATSSATTMAAANVPLPPTNITAMPISPTMINLSWTASAGAVGYDIYRNSTITPIASTSLLVYSDSGLAPNTLYTYYFKSFNASGTRSVLSAPTATSTLKDIIAPSIPTGLIATPVSDSRINLSWNPATDNVAVTGYNIYRNNAFLTTTASTSFANTGLTASTTYSYQVSAFDASGNLSARSATSSAKTLATGTGTTTNVTVQLLSSSTINIGANNLVQLAVFGSNTLDLNSIIFNSVRFGGAKAVSSDFQYVNSGGQTTLNRIVYGFRTGDMVDLSVGSTNAIFTADTTSVGQHLVADVAVSVVNNQPSINDKIDILIQEMKDRIAAAKARIQMKIDEIEQRLGFNSGSSSSIETNLNSESSSSANSDLHNSIISTIAGLRSKIGLR